MKKRPWQVERENAENLKKFGKNAIRLVLVSKAWNGKMKLTVKGVFKDRPSAKAALDASQKRLAPNGQFCCIQLGDNRILSPRQYAALVKKIEERKASRRAAGAKKAAASRKKNGVTPRRIKCPRCQSTSKVLYSEMGGLQTRRCRLGHEFQHDKWIADRLAMAFLGF